MAKRSVSDFKAKHDPATVIGRLEAELRKANEALGLENAVKELVGTALAGLDTTAPPSWTAAPLAKPSNPGVPTLFLSDLHWGEVVKPAEIGGINKYDLGIAHARMAYTVETAIHLCKILDPNMSYPGIICPLGGDMISGDIHEELKTTNELPTIPTVLDLYEKLSGAIARLADAFGHVFLPCVSGNHGRNTMKTWAKNRNHTSFDWLLYQLLAKRFLNDARITFYVPQGSDALYRVYGTRYLLTHGDQFKAGDSIIGPIGPIMRGNQKKTARNQAVGQDYDVMILGHWHQYMHLARAIVNGSMKGYDEYAASWNFGFEPPTQALWITHPKYGITYRMPVYCEAPSGRAPSKWVSVQERAQ